MMEKCVRCKYYIQHYQFAMHMGFIKSGHGHCLKFDNYKNKRKCDLFKENLEYDKELSDLVDLCSLLACVKKRIDKNRETLKKIDEKIEFVNNKILNKN